MLKIKMVYWIANIIQPIRIAADMIDYFLQLLPIKFVKILTAIGNCLGCIAPSHMLHCWEKQS